MADFVSDTARVHADLKAVLEPTPLQYNQYLSDLHGADIWLKREDLSPVRSYKIRGAYAFFNEILKQDASSENFVCASAGNHAQGFSHACRNYKKHGVIFMPVTTPQQKIMKTRSFGEPHVDIILVGDSFDDANVAALKYCEEKGGIMVPPFDDERIILGQATIAKELLEQLPDGVKIDLMVLPVGGGGLAAGVTHYMKSQSPDMEFLFVEPDNAPSLQKSLRAGKRIKLYGIDNFIDGAAVAEIGVANFDYLKGFDADQVVLAPTNGVCATMIEMLNIEGIVLEPAGALSVDALKRLPKEEIVGKTICCVTSGGNFDFERLPEVKERALKFSGLKKYFILKMPQRPGALKDFLLMLGPNDDIARFEYLKKSARNFGSVLIGIETTDARNFDVLKQKFNEGGLGFQDITDNDLVASLVI